MIRFGRFDLILDSFKFLRKYHFRSLKAHENSSETITHLIKNFLKSYPIFSATIHIAMSAKRTNGRRRTALDYPSYLIFHLSNENCTNNKFLFLSKSMKWKQIESYGSLTKLLNTLQRSQINLILFSGRVSTNEAGRACFTLLKFKLQTNDETGIIVFRKED